MEHGCITPHSQLKDMLFLHKNTLRRVFRDVLGLLEVHHVSLHTLSIENQLIILSSDPAIFYNLFQGNLWQYDKTYHLNWWNSAPIPCSWQTLYAPERFDELYYTKQKKPGLFSSLTMQTHFQGQLLVISYASKSKVPPKAWAQELDTLKSMGHYCFERLKHLLPIDAQLATTNPPATSRGLSAGSIADARFLAPADKPRGVAVGEPQGVAVGEPQGVAVGEPQGVAVGEPRDLSMGEQLPQPIEKV